MPAVAPTRTVAAAAAISVAGANNFRDACKGRAGHGPAQIHGRGDPLAIESVEKGWGGPFGAVIIKDGEIIGRGQNRVLLTGCPVYHAEVTAIIDARPSSIRRDPAAITEPAPYWK